MPDLNELLREECKELCQYIDPSSYIRMFRKYKSEYFPFFEEYLKHAYSFIVEQNPEVEFHISARRKANFETNKKFVSKIKEHMTFVNCLSEKKEAAMKYLFGFLKNSNTGKEKIDEIKNIVNEVTNKERFRRITNIIALLDKKYYLNKDDIKKLSSLFDISDYSKREQLFTTFLFELDIEMENSLKDELFSTFTSFEESSIKNKFERIYALLTKQEQDTLTNRLGMPFDIFAFRFILHNVSFPAQKETVSFETDSEGNKTFFIQDKNGKKFPIRAAEKIKTDDILQNNKGIYIITDKKDKTVRNLDFNKTSAKLIKCLIDQGKIEKISERNLLYDDNVPASNSREKIKQNRNLSTAQLDSNSCFTLLWDSLELNNMHLDIYPDTIREKDGKIEIKIKDNYIPLENLSELKLKKYDDRTLTPFVYNLDASLDEYNRLLQMHKVKGRSKDYINMPKDGGYMALHDVVQDPIYGYFIERQNKTLLMEEDSNSEKLASNHTFYKKSKKLKPESQHISDKEDFYDKWLNNLDIFIEDLIPEFLLVTQVVEIDPLTYEKQNVVKTWKPDERITYEYLTGKSFQEFKDKHLTEKIPAPEEPDVMDDLDYPSI